MMKYIIKFLLIFLFSLGGINLTWAETQVCQGGTCTESGGSGTVTSIATGSCLTGGPITATGTIDLEIPIEIEATTPYIIVAADTCKLKNFQDGTAFAVTLPQAGTAGFETDKVFIFRNDAAGDATITPTTSLIDKATTLVLKQNESAICISDGTDYSCVGRGLIVEADDFTAILGRGKIYQGATSFATCVFIGKDNKQNGVCFYHHATEGTKVVPICGGVENDCDHILKLASGKKREIQNSSSVAKFTLSESTGALTNVTLDVEATGNVLTTISYIYIHLASCIGATASNALNDPGNGATLPTAACNDAGTLQRPSSDYAGGAVNSAELILPLPPGWTGNIDFVLRYLIDAASPTGNVKWDISTVCRAITEDWDAVFNTKQTITDAVAADEVLNDATQTSLTTTGCAAEEDMHVLVSRNGTSDSNNDTAKALWVRFTIRRTQ